MTGVGIKKACQDRYTFAPPFRAGSHPARWCNSRRLLVAGLGTKGDKTGAQYR